VFNLIIKPSVFLYLYCRWYHQEILCKVNWMQSQNPSPNLQIQKRYRTAFYHVSLICRSHWSWYSNLTVIPFLIFFLLIVMQSPSQLLLGWSLNASWSVVLLISVYTYQASDRVLDHWTLHFVLVCTFRTIQKWQPCKRNSAKQTIKWPSLGISVRS